MSAVDGLYTVNDIVIAALKKSGVLGLGQPAGGSDVLDAQNDLMDMWAEWNVKTWLTFDKLDMSFIADGRSTPYTVGPAGNFAVTQRPDRVEAAYLRFLNTGSLPVDQPLSQIFARESYANVALKTMVSFPKAYFYDTASPLGNIFFYPFPQGGGIYEMHIIIKNAFPLTLPLNLSVANLPRECLSATKFCLARRLRQAYGKGLRPDVELNKLAKNGLETMRNSHVQVPELTMPAMLKGTSHYNIYGDITY